MKKTNNHIDIYKHLSKIDLIDYSQGILGSSNIYKIELHLNECEFCNDALEGITLLKNPEKTLNTIDEALLGRKKNVPAVNYLAITAGLVLVAILSILYWFITKPSNKQQNLAAPAVKKEIFTTKAQLPINSIKTEDAKQLNSDSIVKKERINSFSSIVKNKIKQPVKLKRNKPKNIPNTHTNKLKEENTVMAKIVIPQNQQINNISINNKPLPLIENQIKTEKKTNISKPVSLKNQKNPTPKGGMSAYKAYLVKNLVYPQKAINNNTKGIVIIEVLIATDGSIKNMHVTKGLKNGCDIEAMRLISAGPTWTPKVENKIAVEGKRQIKIKFKNY